MSHIQYAVNNLSVPSVTTVIENLGWNKQALIGWTYKIAKSGEDPKRLKEEAATIGTMTHKLVEDHIKGNLSHLFLAQEDELIRAQVGYQAYLNWENKNIPVYIKTEVPLTSKEYLYGGTVDILLQLDNKIGIVDLKTSNGIYSEYIIQVAAYRKLVEENLCPVEFCAILKLNKDKATYQYFELAEDVLDNAFKVFLNCLEIHNLKEELKFK